jgi:hypothetical protein
MGNACLLFKKIIYLCIKEFFMDSLNLKALDFQVICYQIKATPKNGQSSYLIYNGHFFMDKQIAISTCDSCNSYWGNDVVFEIIEIKK